MVAVGKDVEASGEATSTRSARSGRKIHRLPPEVLDRLLPASQRALGRADAFRRGRRRDRIHMEHLLVGLYEEDTAFTRPIFAGAGILDVKALAETLQQAREKVDLPGGTPHEPAPLGSESPPFSRHAVTAVTSAAAIADEDRRKRPRILVLDPLFNRGELGKRLEATGYAPVYERDAESGFASFGSDVPDLVVVSAAWAPDFADAMQRRSEDDILRSIPVVQIPASSDAPDSAQLDEVVAQIRSALERSPARIRPEHLLRGAFAVKQCGIIRALARVGQHLRDIRAAWVEGALTAEGEAVEEPELEEAEDEEHTSETPPTDDAEVAAPPEPRRRRVGVGRGADNDRVAKKDQLGFVHYVAAFADLIASPDTKPPLTIGIFGSWGMGKSFLLEHIAAKFEGNGTDAADGNAAGRAGRNGAAYGPDAPRIYTVRFNAWEYNAAPRIWPELARKVVNAIDDPSSGLQFRVLKAWRKLRRNLGPTLRAEWPQLVLWSVAIGVIAGLFYAGLQRIPKWPEEVLGVKVTTANFAAVSAFFGGLAGILKLLKDTVVGPLGRWITTLFSSGSYGGPTDYMEEIKKDLLLLNQQLEHTNGRILIIVDDLDRCEPDKAIEVLQAINLLLNFDKANFVVCLGIDARIITSAVERHYRDLLGPAGMSGYEYLDKIIQIPFRIPEPSWTDVERLLESQLLNPTPAAPAPKPTPSAPGVRAAPQDIVRRANGGGNGARDTTDPTPAATTTARPEITAPAPRPADGPPVQTEAPPSGAVADAVTLPAAADHHREAAERLSFTHDELTAFKGLSRFLRGNPRHIKRLVNVYSLVRSLANLKRDALILDHPQATISWVVMCGQWPYASHMMLERFDELEAERNKDVGENESPPDPPTDDVLGDLFKDVRPKLSPEKLARWDHDIELLAQLLRRDQCRMTWNGLRTVRKYTVNFNPAIEGELRAEEARRATAAAAPAV